MTDLRIRLLNREFFVDADDVFFVVGGEDVKPFPLTVEGLLDVVNEMTHEFIDLNMMIADGYDLPEEYHKRATAISLKLTMVLVALGHGADGVTMEGMLKDIGLDMETMIRKVKGNNE